MASRRRGTLDGFIDDWHDFFGLPEGTRPVLPRDQLNIAYRARRYDCVLTSTSPAVASATSRPAVGYEIARYAEVGRERLVQP